MFDSPLEEAVLITVVVALVARHQKRSNLWPLTVDRLVAIFASIYGLSLVRSLAHLTLDDYGVLGDGWRWLVQGSIITLWFPVFLLAVGQFSARRLAKAAVAIPAVCFGFYLWSRVW